MQDEIPTAADLRDSLRKKIERLERINEQLRYELKESEQARKALAHHLERRADGMDPLTQSLRAEVESLKEKLNERIDLLVDTELLKIWTHGLPYRHRRLIEENRRLLLLLGSAGEQVTAELTVTADQDKGDITK